MTVAEIEAELRERVERARAELVEAAKIAPNSYGHGYEAGVLDSCNQILDFIAEGEDPL